MSAFVALTGSSEETLLESLNTHLEENNEKYSVAESKNAKSEIFSISLFLAAKARNAYSGSQHLLSIGQSSWAAVDAYQSVFFSIRAVLALFGIVVVGQTKNGKSRTYVIDGFPWMGRHDHKKKFTRAYKNWSDCLGVMPYGGARFEQRSFWKLFQRLVSISDIGISSEALRQQLRNISPTEMRPRRNLLIYRNEAWGWPDDLFSPATPDELEEKWPDNAHEAIVAATDRPDGIFILANVAISLLATLHAELEEHSSSPTKSAKLSDYLVKPAATKPYLHNPLVVG